MFQVIVFAILCALVVGSLRGSESMDLFIQDVSFSILSTIYEGAEESRRAGNDHYRLFILWKDSESRSGDCKYCHYGLQNTREATDDTRKFDYASEGFIFPTPTNTDIPPYKINKDWVLTHIMKQLVDLFSGVDVFLINNTCCHEFELRWNF